MAVSMMLDYLGEKPAAAAVEGAIVELLRAGQLTGVGTGMHATDAVGDLVSTQLRAAAVAR